MIRRHFLRISASWARFRKLLRPETLHENEIRHAITSARRTFSSLLRPTCKAFCFWQTCRTGRSRLAIQLKSSRCAEDEEGSAYAVLRNRVKPAKHSKRKVLASIFEDANSSRSTELLREFETHDTHRGMECQEFSEERVRFELSMQRVDAHAKKCKFRS